MTTEDNIMGIVTAALPNATYEEARDAYIKGSDTRAGWNFAVAIGAIAMDDQPTENPLNLPNLLPAGGTQNPFAGFVPENPFEYGSAYWQAWKMGFDEWREGKRSDTEIKAVARRVLALILVANAGPPPVQETLAGPPLPERGWQAAAKGFPIEACPFPYGSIACAAWRAGWDKYHQPPKPKAKRRWLIF